MKRILIGVAALLVAVVVIGGGAYLWKNWTRLKTPKPPAQTEVKLPVTREQGLLPGTEPEADLPPTETSGQAKTPATKGTPVPGKATPGSKLALGEGLGPEPDENLPISPGTRDIAAPTPTPREQRPTSGQPGGRLTPRPVTQPVGTPAIEPEIETTATPKPITPAVTPTPSSTPASAPAPAPGNYSVRTIEPVFAPQLATVRAAMNSLGVHLQEQKAEQQQLQAYRIAVGYFRTKEEAESWAQYNFRPRGISYYVYPVQGMFSIQIGVYAQQQNVDAAMREFYRKYQGGRLPIRTEMATIAKQAYHLSLNRITKSLADKVWDKLTSLGIQAEISGI